MCEDEEEEQGMHLDPSYLDHKHSSTQNVTSVVTPELDASNFFDLVEVDGLNLFHALLQISLRVQHVICRDVTAVKVNRRGKRQKKL